MRDSRSGILTLVCTAALVLGAAGCSRQSGAGALERGNKLFDEKDYKGAVIEYRAAVAHDPSSGIARQKLAQTLQLIGSPDAAWREFVRAADLLPDNEAAQLDAGYALLQTGQYEDARSRAERVLARNSSSLKAQMLRAYAAAGLRDIDSAVKDVQKALELDPSRALNYANLGSLELARGRAEEAEAALKQAAVLAAPNDPTPELALGNFYWRMRRYAEAEAAMKAAVARKPADVKANSTLATLYMVTGRAADAEAPLKATAANADAFEAQLTLADYYVGRNRQKEAIPVLERLLAREEVRSAASARLAGIEYVEGHPDAAYKKLDELLARQPRNAPILVLKTRWLLFEGRTDEALTTAKAAVAADAKSVEALYVLGNVHVARRETEPAMAAYKGVLGLNPRMVPAQLDLAKLNMATGQPAAAVQLATNALATAPKNLEARLALVQGLRRQGNYTRASEELKPLLVAAPKAAAVQVEAGEIALGQKDLTRAAAAFDQALALDPGMFAAIAGRVTVDLAQKRTPEALRRVEAALARNPKNAPIIALAGRTYAVSGDLRRAEDLYQRALDADPGYMPAYHQLGQVYVREKRLDEARQRYEVAIQRQPTNIAAHTMVAMLLQAQNRNTEAKARYEKILQIDPRSAVAANNLAYMNAEAGTSLDMALQLAQSAKAAYPDEPDINDTLGWVYYKKDLATLAIDPLRQSVERVPTNATYRFHLGMAYLKTGDKEKAREMLQQALKLDPRFDGAADARRALDGLGS
jgi:tetratricopeptide (TPR) repeat protein